MTRRALTLTLLAATATPAVLSQSDCTRWIALYRARLLHARATHALRGAKRRLSQPVHPMRHRMGPIESLRRFQIACGELTDTPTLTALLPPAYEPAVPVEVAFPDYGPPSVDFPAPPTMAETDVPLTPYVPVVGPAVPVAATPECGTWLLVMTGVAVPVVRRKEVA